MKVKSYRYTYMSRKARYQELKKVVEYLMINA